MAKESISQRDRNFLELLRGGPLKRSDITGPLGISNTTFQRIFDRLKGLGYVERLGYNRYGLTEKGREFLRVFNFEEISAFGSENFRRYLKQFPSLYQAVTNLTIYSIVSKQTSLFEKFTSAYPGIILAGDPKLGKTPLGEIICELIGLDPTTHKLDVQLVTTGEIRGRSRGKSGFDASPWFDRRKVISLLDEVDKILNAATSETAKFLAHSDKYYIREDKKRVHGTVPFLTMNVSGSTEKVIEKIEKTLGPAYIKRNAVFNVNVVKPYIPNSYLFFRKVCKDYPRINFKPRILKDEITDSEAELIAALMKRAVKPEKEAFYDERGIEIHALSHYSLTGGGNFETSIYSVVRDHLIALESLEALRPKWRKPFYDDWRKHEGTRSPEAEENLRKVEEERQRLDQELKERQKEIKEKKIEKLDNRFEFDMEYSGELTKLREIIAALKNLPGGKWKYKTKKIRDSITKQCDEYFDSGKRTPEKLEELKSVIPKRRAVAEPFLREYKEEQARDEAEKRRKQGQKDREKEERGSIIKEFKTLKKTLYTLKGKDSRERLWTSKTKRLRSNIGGVIEQQKGKSLNYLRDLLAQARDKANPMFEEYREQKEIEKAISSINPLGDLLEGVSKVGGKVATWLTTPKKTNPPGSEVGIKEKEKSQEAAPPPEKPKTSEYFISPGDYLKSIISPTIPKKKEKKNLPEGESDAERLRREQEEGLYG